MFTIADCERRSLASDCKTAMLNIRPEQIEIFELLSRQRFEDEMMAHAREFSPRLCEVIGDGQLRVVVRQAIQRANNYGFTNRGPIRLYLELVFLRGSGFDTDPQYPQLGAMLRESGDQMWRAERIVERVVDYQKHVSGPNGINVRSALEAVAALARAPVAFSAAGFVPQLIQEMQRAFPQKVAYVGEPAVTALISEARAAARQTGLTMLRAEALIAVLMFAFGHGCVADPLYPWISQTLADERITDAAARAERLERKAVTWVDHVLSHPSDGAQA